MRNFVRFSLIIAFLLFFTYLFWLRGHHLLFYRQIVLESPIRFAEGYTLTRKFTVDVPTKHWLAIGFQKTFEIDVEHPIPSDEFTIDYRITSGAGVVVRDNHMPREHPDSALLRKGYIVRFIDEFEAEPSTTYELSLRVTRLQPNISSTNPKMMIVIDPAFDRGYTLRKRFIGFVSVGLSLSLLFVILGRRRV